MTHWDYYLVNSKIVNIKPGDKNFHAHGTYYILVQPRPSWMEEFFKKDTHYRYSIKASLEGTFQWLDTWTTTGVSISSGYEMVFRYIVEDKEQDH